jgi:hypothetical protein
VATRTATNRPDPASFALFHSDSTAAGEVDVLTISGNLAFQLDIKRVAGRNLDKRSSVARLVEITAGGAVEARFPDAGWWRPANAATRRAHVGLGRGILPQLGNLDATDDLVGAGGNVARSLGLMSRRLGADAVGLDISR